MKLCKPLILAGAAALPLLFSACSTTEPAPSALSEAEQKSLIIDVPLQDKIAVEFIRTWPSENGLTKVLIRARIKTYSMWDWIFHSYQSLDIAYRVAWYNDKGVEVPEGKKPAWNYLNAEYGEELGFGSMAPAPEIKNYKLFIRLSKPEEPQTAVQPANPVQEPAKSEDTSKPAPKTALEVKTPPSSVTPIKQEAKPAPAVKKAEESQTAAPAKSAPESVKPEDSAKSAPTTALEVKTPPSSVTPIKLEVKPAPAVKKAKTQAEEEAEADAAAIRQATPAKK